MDEPAKTETETRLVRKEENSTAAAESINIFHHRLYAPEHLEKGRLLTLYKFVRFVFTIDLKKNDIRGLTDAPIENLDLFQSRNCAVSTPQSIAKLKTLEGRSLTVSKTGTHFEIPVTTEPESTKESLRRLIGLLTGRTGPVYATLFGLWFLSVYLVYVIGQREGLKGLVALSFAALFSACIAHFGGKRETGFSDLAKNLQPGGSPFKVISPLLKFSALLIILYIMLIGLIPVWVTGVQLAWAFVFSFMLTGLFITFRSRENPLAVLSGKKGNDKPALGTLIITTILIALASFFALEQLPLISAFLRPVVILIWVVSSCLIIMEVYRRCK